MLFFIIVTVCKYNKKVVPLCPKSLIRAISRFTIATKKLSSTSNVSLKFIIYKQLKSLHTNNNMFVVHLISLYAREYFKTK